MRIATITAAVLLSGTAVFAQDEVARKQSVEVAARVPLEKAMKGAPYSAETVVESSQALADGNHINRRTTGRVYRDGEGRTRREEEAPITVKTASGVVTNLHTSISIVDPVGGFSYSLDPENKIAWRTPMGASAAIMGKLEASQVEQRKVELERSMSAEAAAKAARGTSSGDAQSKAAAVEQEKVTAAARGGSGAVAGGFGGEVMMRGRGYAIVPDTPLEHKMLDGLPVEGHKTSTVIPAGQIGNEQPITITSEEWRSPDLNVLVMTRHNDPRTGESSYRLTNIIRAEPDPSLFLVPADYTVKDTNIRRMLGASRNH